MNAHIVIDGRMLGETGVGRYTSELLRGLGTLGRGTRYTVIVRTKSALPPLPKNFTTVVADIPFYSLREQRELPRILKRLAPTLVHFPHYNVPIRYRGKFLVTIHDLIPLKFKNRASSTLHPLAYELKQAGFRLVLRRALRRAAAVIVPTNHVRRDVIKRFPYTANKISVIYEGVASFSGKADLAVLKKHRLTPKGYLLYVGNLFVHKNVDILLAALPRLPRLKAVLVGKRNSFQDRFRHKAEELGLSERVLFPGFLDDEELAALYKNAGVFVFPSLDEGFGLPPLEAMAMGCPVASSNAAPMPEVLGNAARYFRPNHPDDLVRAVRAVTSTKTRQAYIERGRQRAALFSFERMTRETHALYVKLLRSS